jgi:hypothetical protein
VNLPHHADLIRGLEIFRVSRRIEQRRRPSGRAPGASRRSKRDVIGAWSGPQSVSLQIRQERIIGCITWKDYRGLQTPQPPWSPLST